MEAESVTLKIVGTKRLIMRSGRMSDPLDPTTKALARLTSKRMKTAADHEEIARIEWNGCLWLESGRPCIPAEALAATFVAAARSRKRKDAGRAGLVVERNAQLDYAGPRDLDELWLLPEFRLRASVKIGNSRTMRTRPCFHDWSVIFTAHFLPSFWNREDVIEMYRLAGFSKGLGDWRPTNGTFSVEEIA
ncbi:hypothetical protein [Bradyrhizobium genomosp. I (2014)]|uniref:hypothetical protein n=1 Tax=Bradyrhizobium genomosp. I (2014) TaxID=2683269 RepID=UPI0004B900AD|nr:hypothetical protein [Bradyrhizobium sp. CCBAU 43298]